MLFQPVKAERFHIDSWAQLVRACFRTNRFSLGQSSIVRQEQREPAKPDVLGSALVLSFTHHFRNIDNKHNGATQMWRARHKEYQFFKHLRRRLRNRKKVVKHKTSSRLGKWSKTQTQLLLLALPAQAWVFSVWGYYDRQQHVTHMRGSSFTPLLSRFLLSQHTLFAFTLANSHDKCTTIHIA